MKWQESDDIFQLEDADEARMRYRRKGGVQRAIEKREQSLKKKNIDHERGRETCKVAFEGKHWGSQTSIAAGLHFSKSPPALCQSASRIWNETMEVFYTQVSSD